MAGESIRRGDVVLVPFPFTDLTATKVRPAVVVSADPQGEDVTLAFISSVVARVQLGATDLVIEPENPDFARTGLNRASMLRMAKLLTLSRAMILRRLGTLSPDLQKKADGCLKRALGLA